MFVLEPGRPVGHRPERALVIVRSIIVLYPSVVMNADCLCSYLAVSGMSIDWWLVWQFNGLLNILCNI